MNMPPTWKLGCLALVGPQSPIGHLVPKAVQKDGKNVVNTSTTYTTCSSTIVFVRGMDKAGYLRYWPNRGINVTTTDCVMTRNSSVAVVVNQ